MSFERPMKKRTRTSAMPTIEKRSYVSRGIARPRIRSAIALVRGDVAGCGSAVK